MFSDDTGHMNLLQSGFDYHFHDTPDYRAQDRAKRAALAKFQSYPANEVEGLATLVRGAPGFVPGKYWRLFQPAQVYYHPTQILADMLGGGIDSGQLQSQPLISG